MSSHTIQRQHAPSAARPHSHISASSGAEQTLAPESAIVLHAAPYRTPSARHIVTRELAPFTRGLSAMLDAGLPIVQSLEAMEQQVESKSFKTVLHRTRTAVQYGNRLSAAMALFPDIFDGIYISMLKAGEISGAMAETLERLAEHLEATSDLRHKVQSAMMYPIAVASIALVLSLAIMLWIVPAFEKIYADLGGTLPLATRILIAMSKTIRSNIHWVAAAGLMAALAIHWLRRTPAGAYAWDRLKLFLPIFGLLTQKVALTRFAEALSQMLRNGIPILQALGLAAEVVNNKVLAAVVLEARQAVEQGATVSSVLKRSPWYPPLLIQMLGTGEKTGRVDEMLERVARYYRNEVTVTVNGLTTLIEPLLIVFLGVVVGGMVLCMFIPIFKLSEIVKF